MKKLFIILFTISSFTNSYGFGLIEYSTVMHSKHHVKQDTTRNNNNTFQVNQSTTELKKTPDKAPESHFTKSLIQWLANGVKTTIEFITSAFIGFGKAILTAIVHLFTSRVPSKTT